MSTLNRTTFPTAVKEHRCEWCGESILVGQSHVQFTGVWEGEFQDWRMHVECHDDAATNDGLRDGFSSYENQRPALKESR